MIEKIVQAIIKDAFWVSLIALLVLYLLDNKVDGYVRYYFDPAILMIICLISGIFMVVFHSRKVDS